MPLARHLYLRHRPEHASIETLFSDETRLVLEQHSWPGNVRELANVVEHATILCDHPPILPEHLPRHFNDKNLKREIREIREMKAPPAVSISVPMAPTTPMGRMSLREMEMMAVRLITGRAVCGRHDKCCHCNRQSTPAARHLHARFGRQNCAGAT